jgi:hypothetical protein
MYLLLKPTVFAQPTVKLFSILFASSCLPNKQLGAATYQQQQKSTTGLPYIAKYC